MEGVRAEGVSARARECVRARAHGAHATSNRHLGRMGRLRSLKCPSAFEDRITKQQRAPVGDGKHKHLTRSKERKRRSHTQKKEQHKDHHFETKVKLPSLCAKCHSGAKVCVSTEKSMHWPAAASRDAPGICRTP